MIRLLVLLSTLCLSLADLPIDCRFNEVVGTWTITETSREGDDSIDCSKMAEVVYTKTFTLEYPNMVTDELGFKGTWTMMDNQGYEININERSYFSSFSYSNDGFDCTKLHTGWARDDTVRHWSCFTGEKVGPHKSQSALRQLPQKPEFGLDEKYVNNYSFIKQINEAQDSWKAKAYPEHEKYTNREMIQRAGGHIKSTPPTAPASAKQKAASAYLPVNFDWRNIDGLNYVSRVRDQGQCGSCYSFASAGLLEARVRIETNNSRQDIFSIQDVLDCSVLAEGCEGGFSYLIAGRYAKDVGFVNEDCVPYAASNQKCHTPSNCSRTYVKEYEFVGGYFGACNEEAMMEGLVMKGPLAVDFDVQDDFYHYHSGIYYPVEDQRIDFDPFYPSDHAVLLVGYGVEPSTGEKYWIVKNSWGDWWGEDGYFRIRRGTNVCGIEASAFDATVIS